MTSLFTHSSKPETYRTDFVAMNDGWNEASSDGDSGCQLIIATEAVEAAVEANPAARDFVASIREAIDTLSCGENYPTIRKTADFVGMSVRTLQRRLAEAGVSHHLLVAQARFATAAAVLERTDAKILELALDLGYSDHANFTRAFRRWAGCAPREYRSNNARQEHEDVPGLFVAEKHELRTRRPGAEPSEPSGLVAIPGAFGTP